MSLPGQLYQLQRIDLELRGKQQLLDEIEKKLNDNEALAETESNLASQKQLLASVEKEQKNAEWGLEDIQERVNKLNNKLYDGTIKNTKELINIESEVKNLKSGIRRKENGLLELMSQVEELEARVKSSVAEFQQLKREWKQGQEKLSQDKVETEAELVKLSADRQWLVQQISPEAMRLYEQIRRTREQAVVKVERGRCQGCHISLPTSQWQRAKAGDLIQCNSCSRILYSE